MTTAVRSGSNSVTASTIAGGGSSSARLAKWMRSISGNPAGGVTTTVGAAGGGPTPTPSVATTRRSVAPASRRTGRCSVHTAATEPARITRRPPTAERSALAHQVSAVFALMGRRYEVGPTVDGGFATLVSSGGAEALEGSDGALDVHVAEARVVRHRDGSATAGAGCRCPTAARRRSSGPSDGRHRSPPRRARRSTAPCGGRGVRRSRAASGWAPMLRSRAKNTLCSSDASNAPCTKARSLPSKVFSASAITRRIARSRRTLPGGTGRRADRPCWRSACRAAPG